MAVYLHLDQPPIRDWLRDRVLDDIASEGAQLVISNAEPITWQGREWPLVMRLETPEGVQGWVGLGDDLEELLQARNALMARAQDKADRKANDLLRDMLIATPPGGGSYGYAKATSALTREALLAAMEKVINAKYQVCPPYDHHLVGPTWVDDARAAGRDHVVCANCGAPIPI